MFLYVRVRWVYVVLIQFVSDRVKGRVSSACTCERSLSYQLCSPCFRPMRLFQWELVRGRCVCAWSHISRFLKPYSHLRHVPTPTQNRDCRTHSTSPQILGLSLIKIKALEFKNELIKLFVLKILKKVQIEWSFEPDLEVSKFQNTLTFFLWERIVWFWISNLNRRSAALFEIKGGN